MQTFIKTQKPQGLTMFVPKKSNLTDEQKALQVTHKKLSQQQGQKSDQIQASAQGTVICCCGSVGCRIGPFVPDERRGKK